MKKQFVIFLALSLLITAIQSSYSEEEKEIEFLLFTEFIPKDEIPFLIKVKFLKEGNFRIKAEIISKNKSASKLWNGNKWVYSRDDWDKMVKVDDKQIFIYLQLDKGYSGFNNLKDKERAELRISYKNMETGEINFISKEVKLLDIENTKNGTRGVIIDGYFNFYNESFMNNDMLVSIENSTSILAIYLTEDNKIEDYYKKIGYFKLAVPIGNYTLFFREKNGGEIYSQNISAERNKTIFIGNKNFKNEEKLLITEVYYDTYIPYEADEYVKIYNPTDEEIELSNFILENKNGKIRFPYSSFIFPKKSIFITKSAEDFYSENLFLPDYEFKNSLSISQVEEIDRGFSFSNDGDYAILKNSDGKIIDVVVYGNASYKIGWNGRSANRLTEGSILKRNTKEFEFLNDFSFYQSKNYSSEGDSFIDTNTSSDFESPRVFKIRQSNFKFTSFNFYGNITAFVSPDSSFETIVKEIKNAKETILINIYEFTNLYLMDEIINKSKEGVKVKILLEGRPLPNLTDTEKYIAEKISENGGEVSFMINNDTIKDRYQFNHAKYVVIDNKTLIVLSENFKNSGVPFNNTFGNRGWGIVIRNSNTAKYFSELFFTDFNPTQKDIFVFDKNHSIYGSANKTFIPEYQILSGSYLPNFQSKIINGNFTVYPIVSPENSAYLIQLLNSAKKFIYIEQMILNRNWTKNYKNLFLETVIKKAREGIEVKVLLDSSFVAKDEDNKKTVKYLNEIAKDENLNLLAKLIYLDGLDLLHNKGVIVDDKVLISSINWNYWAFTYNREVGIIIQNQETANYFKEVFLYDWNLKEKHSGIKEDLPKVELKNSESYSLHFFVGLIIGVFLISIFRDILANRRKKK